MLKDKVAIVFGGSKGIGKGIARELYEEGADVLIVSRSKRNLSKAIYDIKRENKTNNIESISGDISDNIHIKNIKDIIIEKYGKLDIMILNGGGPPAKSYEEATIKDWEDAINAQLIGPIQVTKALIPIMKRSEFGRIIAISSTVAMEPTPKMVLSASTRAALTTYLKGISIELAADGITVNAVAVGGVETDRIKDLFLQIADGNKEKARELIKKSQEGIPIGRLATADEFAKNLLWLCTSNASYITGQNIVIDGGLVKSVY